MDKQKNLNLHDCFYTTQNKKGPKAHNIPYCVLGWIELYVCICTNLQHTWLNNHSNVELTIEKPYHETNSLNKTLFQIISPTLGWSIPPVKNPS